jgi:hypothetical protein
MLDSNGWVLAQADEQLRHADLAAARLRLDEPAFDAAFREGRAAPFEDLEAMAEAV